MTPAIRWWDWLPLPWRKWRLIGCVSAADEVPERLPPKGVIIVGSVGQPKWAAFNCPCGHGHQMMINLDSTRAPTWRIESLRPLSIRPSIDDITLERRCHFLVTRGKITWSAGSRGG